MRQIRLLESRYRLTVAGFGVAPDAHAEFVGVSRSPAPMHRKVWRASKLLLGLSESYYWERPEIRSVLATLGGRQFDLIVANDIAALPLATRLANGRPVLMDAHEYAPLEFEDRRLWRLLFGRLQNDLCRRYLPKSAAMVTVCQGIADAYAQHFGVEAEVVLNAPAYQQLNPSRVEPGRIRMVHHGAAIRSRHLESMIDLMQHVDDRFTLDFFLVGNDEAYLSELQKRAANDSRIRFLAPVPLKAICTTLNRYDVGIFLLPPVNFNYDHALPNKFFEFIQARLALAIGPSPEMAKLVTDHGLGIVAKSFEPADLAGLLSAISQADLIRYKAAAEVAAKSLNYETSGRTLLALVERIIPAEQR